LRGDTSTAALEAAREKFRARVPEWREDCVLSTPMEEAARFLADDGWRVQVAVAEAVR